MAYTPSPQLLNKLYKDVSPPDEGQGYRPSAKLLNKLSGGEPSESYLKAIGMAAPRMGLDAANAAAEFIPKIPHYVSKGLSEAGGIPELISNHPKHALKQVLAGLAEYGQSTFNTPHDIANYASNRLNLIPKNINTEIQKGRMPEDTMGIINETLGKPEYKGEELLRGIASHPVAAISAKKIASEINPLNYTDKALIADVLNAEKKQVKEHTKEYTKIWNEANRTGFSTVPTDNNLLSSNLDVIKKYKTPREYLSLKKFIDNPTLENAQKAQSDMNQIHRKLEKKSRSGSLTSEENSVYDAAHAAERHIEENMFKNKQGHRNQSLKDRYDAVTGSYRVNVVPYKYNPAIQGYKNKELTDSALVQRLKAGKFAAQKGEAHPRLMRVDMVKKALVGLGIGGGIFEAGKGLHDYLAKHD